MALNSSRQWIPLQKQLVPKTKENGTNYQKNILRRHRETIDAALKRGYLRYLDEELVLENQRGNEDSEVVSELQEVRRISLSRCHVQALDDIAILSCTKLRICNLGSCYLRDISAFYGSINLLKLDVSNNQICRLPQSDFWSSLSSLRVLYLHGNGLSGREALSRLNACGVLHVLTLHDTPLALIKNYRHHVVNSILSLRALDHYVISDEEIIENLHLTGSFQPLTNHFKLQLYSSPPKGISYNEELRGVYRLLLTVDRVLARHSPVILVQRCVRGWLVRKALAKSTNQRIRSLAARTCTRAFKSQPYREKNSQQSGLVISAEIPLPRHHKDATLSKKGKQHSSSNIPPPPPTSPYRRSNYSPRPIETHVLGTDGKTSRTKYFMHINLRKLQQTVTEAESLESEGVNKHFRTAFKKPSINKKDCGEKRKKCDNEFEDAITEQIKNEAKPSSPSTEQCGNTDSDAVQVSGAIVPIMPHDQRPDLATVKKMDGEEVRKAEKVILEGVTKLREPQKIPNKPEVSAKDELLFTRAVATMTLSTLRSVERAHLSNKKSETLNQKMSLVAKIKQDRVTRRAKIESYHREARERTLDWRSEEDQRLEEQREKLKEQRNSDLLERSQAYDQSAENRYEQLKDQKLACEFGVQNTMIGSTLLKEDCKALKENEAIEKRDVVREAREQAIERQEMVKRYMELRRIKLLQEGEEARRKLDSKMLEAASNRLIASKRKIAREVARKQAAKEAIALAKEELRKGPCRPGEAMQSSQGPPVVSPNEQGQPHPATFSADRTSKNPSHLRRTNRESHSTWQRGSRVVSSTDEGHFPLIGTVSDTPLMYGMMQPGTKRTSLVEPSSMIDSELSSSATSSMVVTKPLTVR